MLSEKVEKELSDLSDLVAKELKKINSKPEMTPADLKAATDVMCLLEKIEKIQNGDIGDEFSNENRSFNRGSYRRMRNPMNGRYMDYGYSGHSVHDRMIAALEELMDQAKTDYDRETISNGIRMIRQYER